MLVKQEHAMKNLLSRMPNDVAETFSDAQLSALKVALASRQWGVHPIDARGTFSIPFSKWRIYYVFLLGKNKRQLSRREQQVSALASAIVLLTLLTFCCLVGLLALYLLKSAAGIDLLPGASLGIWGWWKELWQ